MTVALLASILAYVRERYLETCGLQCEQVQPFMNEDAMNLEIVKKRKFI